MVYHEVGLVYIINKFMFKNKAQPFNCIMIYQDKSSGFCFLRPLLYRTELEIVMELFKIFTSYGPAKEVHVHMLSQEMVTNIKSQMEVFCPMFKINFIKQLSGTNDAAMHVVTKLHKWMEDTNKEQWEIGCRIVQRQINTEVADGSKVSPHRLFFKNFGNDVIIDDSDKSPVEERNVEDNSSSVPQVETAPNITIKQEIEDGDIDRVCRNLKSYVTVLEEGILIKNCSDHNVQIKQEKE